MANRLFTNKERNVFEQICRLKQSGVMRMMRQFLTQHYGIDNVETNNAYLLAKGDIPVGIVAHADTVFSIPPKEFYYDTEKNVMWSPDGMGADDRAGIFMITRIIRAGYRPHVIITTDEESGCIGAIKLSGRYKTFPYDLKFLIQLDRRGIKDSVFYDCNNVDFEKFINSFGFETNYGTLSDISILAPAWGVAAVNFSVGYKEEHSYQEHLFVNAMFDTITKVKNILDFVIKEECPVYEYIEAISYYRGYHSYYEDSWWDDGYNVTKHSPTDVFCAFCGQRESTSNMLPIRYGDAEDAKFLICTECYSKQYENMEWCYDCNEGWLLTKSEKDSLKGLNLEQRVKWKCRKCRGDCKHDGYSGKSESGAWSFPTGGNGSEYGCTNGEVGECERQNDTLYEWSSL